MIMTSFVNAGQEPCLLCLWTSDISGYVDILGVKSASQPAVRVISDNFEILGLWLSAFQIYKASRLVDLDRQCDPTVL